MKINRNNPFFSPLPTYMIDQMRSWVAECEWRDGPDALDELTDAEIIQGVERWYAGGVTQFLRDSAE